MHRLPGDDDDDDEEDAEDEDAEDAEDAEGNWGSDASGLKERASKLSSIFIEFSVESESDCMHDTSIAYIV